MPEYLAPGVYVGETSFRSKSIEGVSTTTTGFIGPARFGPLTLKPGVITSLAEYERVYGGGEKLNFSDQGETDHYLWHAVRGFFAEGGNQLYVSRVFCADPASGDGRARGRLGVGRMTLNLAARFPGSAGNARVRFIPKAGPNVLVFEQGVAAVHSLEDRDIVWVKDADAPASRPPGSLTRRFPAPRGRFLIAQQDSRNGTWLFSAGDDAGSPQIGLGEFRPGQNREIRVVTVSVIITPLDGSSGPEVVSDLPLDPGHQRAGSKDSLLAYFAEQPARFEHARTVRLVITSATETVTGLGILDALCASWGAAARPASPPRPTFDETVVASDASDEARCVDVIIDHGSDGKRPTAAEFAGVARPSDNFKTGLRQFEDIDEISIVAAPGSTFRHGNGDVSDAQTIASLLIAHAEQMRYRIAVLDSADNMSVTDVRALRSRFDSSYAALYYPWVRVLDPITRGEINLPPSGFVAGIYARNDVQRGVWKAPANEVVNLAVGLEQSLSPSELDLLNAEGVNCFRFFEGRGFRLWGARTASSDPEWKYVNLRRYFAYLEHSIDQGTQWVVFEPNGDTLWNNVRRTIEDFLLNEWQAGALMGDKPEQAFFVKCDRSTMTQSDIDNGRLICLIGVAPLRPAEFVIFRIGQWTADRKC
jgi:phage tail sheath protein FI